MNFAFSRLLLRKKNFLENLKKFSKKFSNYRQGKEVFITYGFEPCQNNGIFYTDSNGLEMVMRNRTKLVSASFYPVTTSIFIQDNQTDLSVLTDRSQGGTSLRDGEVSTRIT